MKQYTPKRIEPNTHQFYSYIKDKLSDKGLQSPAGLAVRHIFQAAEAIYHSLAFLTNEQISVFVDAHKYLTPLQEHDLVSLTANYVALLSNDAIYQIVQCDETISEEDRATLKSALDLYSQTARATCIALGNPRWIE